MVYNIYVFGFVLYIPCLVGLPGIFHKLCCLDNFCFIGCTYYTDYYINQKSNKADVVFHSFLLEPDDTNEYLLCEIVPALLRPYVRELGQHLRTQQEYVNEQKIKISDYEQYIENWAHEIKKPLSLMTLLLDNRKNEMSPLVHTRMLYVRDHARQDVEQIGKKMTVCQLYAKQIRHRANVRHGTKQGRKQLMRILQEDKLGACRIENVKLSDAKEWALRMKEKGYGFKTINNHKRSLKAAFYTAIQDDCIRKNPFDFQLNTVLEDDTEPKEPLSPTQEAAFLSFVQHDKVYQKYYDEIIILLGTGLRISELCGLTEADIDLDKQLIHVDHQLLKIADVGYYVETPKTKSGNRVIPMSEKVLEAFQRVLNKRKYAQPVILEGYTKFLFLNRNGLPKVAVNYESMFRGLVRKYNKTQKVALPKVMTPHTLRHTFCTTLANAGMNPKALQYIMGHSNINMTLNYYAHTTSETSITEMKRLIA